jgi:hypothetical protein
VRAGGGRDRGREPAVVSQTLGHHRGERVVVLVAVSTGCWRVGTLWWWFVVVVVVRFVVVVAVRFVVLVVHAVVIILVVGSTESKESSSLNSGNL